MSQPLYKLKKEHNDVNISCQKYNNDGDYFQNTIYNNSLNNINFEELSNILLEDTTLSIKEKFIVFLKLLNKDYTTYEYDK